MVSQSVLVWKSFGKNFTQNFICPNSNTSELLPEAFQFFVHN